MITNIELVHLVSSQGIKIYGSNAGDYSGVSVSAAGDVNGDNIDDVIIGAYRAYPNNRIASGESYIVFGKSTGWNNIDLNNLSSSDGIKIQGSAAYDNSGWSVSNAGDVNNDGISDIIIGADDADPFGRSVAGESYIIFGKNTTWENIDLRNLTIPQGIRIYGAIYNDHSGFSVSKAGDVNGDNIDDIIIGAYTADSLGPSKAGESYIIFGKNTGWANIDLNGLTFSQGVKIYGSNAEEYSGYSVSTAGDVNGDNIDDIIIGAYRASPFNRSEAGASYVVFGKNTGWETIDLGSLTLSQGIKIYGAASGDNSGISVSNAGDVNNDGYGDVIIGAWHANPFGRSEAGESYIIFGKNTGFTIDLANLTSSQGIKIYGAASNDNSGRSVSNAGDVNGDGIVDVIIGADEAAPFQLNFAGESYVIFGKNTGWENIDLGSLTGTQGIKIYGSNAGDYSGVSVSTAGDVNSDGIDDLIIGAPQADPFGRDKAGESYIVFGVKTPTESPTIITSFPTTLPTYSTISPSLFLTDQPTLLPTHHPVYSPTFAPTLLTNSPVSSTLSPAESPTTIISDPKSAEEQPLYKQEWLWGVVSAVVGILGIVITIVSCYYKRKNDVVKQEVIVLNNNPLVTPIGISLDASKDIEVISFNASKVMFNYTDTLSKTSWVGSRDAILVYDHNKNKIVDNGHEIVLTRWSKNAKTDFEALLEVFDSNKDNLFNSQDDKFDQFYIWQDKNQNGISEEGELTILHGAGIKYIDFNMQVDVTEEMKSQGILNTAEVYWTSGVITKAYDLVFEYEVGVSKAL